MIGTLVHGSSMVEDPATYWTLCDSSSFSDREVMELLRPHPRHQPGAPPDARAGDVTRCRFAASTSRRASNTKRTRSCRWPFVLLRQRCRARFTRTSTTPCTLAGPGHFGLVAVIARNAATFARGLVPSGAYLYVHSPAPS